MQYSECSKFNAIVFRK